MSRDRGALTSSAGGGRHRGDGPDLFYVDWVRACSYLTDAADWARASVTARPFRPLQDLAFRMPSTRLRDASQNNRPMPRKRRPNPFFGNAKPSATIAQDQGD